MLLCFRHHRPVHEGGWRIASDKDGETVVFFTPGGRAVADAPAAPGIGGGATDAPAASTPADAPAMPRIAEGTAERPAAPMPGADLDGAPTQGNPARGVDPDGRGLAPRYRRDRDIPYRIEAAAWEALDPVEDGEDGEERPGAAWERRAAAEERRAGKERRTEEEGKSPTGPPRTNRTMRWPRRSRAV